MGGLFNLLIYFLRPDKAPRLDEHIPHTDNSC